MQNLPSTYKSWILKHRPTVGETLGRKHLEYRELSIPQVGEGGALLKLNFLSFDASQQIMAMGGTGYFVSDLDAPMPCLCVGTIVSVGKDCKHPVGTKLHFRGSYSEYHYLTAKELEGALVVDQDIAEDDYLSVGSYTTGLTVFVGLNKVAKDNIKPGKTLVVSAASGGVGQLVIQVAKLYEMRVVAITGGEDKCKDLIENYQVDAAVNYRDPNFSEKLREACPNKVDIYWDNVGGDISDEVYANLNLFSRVIVCGLLTDYSERKGQTYKNFANILLSRARVEGFIVWDSPELIVEGAKQISSWLKEKKLKFEKTILDFDKAPDGITMLLSGSKKGKLLARV